MSELPKEVTRALESIYGPIRARFTLNRIPQGGAPEFIKEQWIGIPLPVREQSLAQLAFGTIEYFDFLSFNAKRNDDPIGIAGIEAVHALEEAERFEAAEFWTPYQDGLFNFRGYEGDLETVES